MSLTFVMWSVPALDSVPRHTVQVLFLKRQPRLFLNCQILIHQLTHLENIVLDNDLKIVFCSLGNLLLDNLTFSLMISDSCFSLLDDFNKQGQIDL